jgi:transposase
MESITLTYEELAERLGIGVDSARIKARRMKQHGWQILPANRPGGKARVVIPEGALPEQLPERSGAARKRYDEMLPERFGVALGELQASRERLERLTIEATEARTEARLMRESLEQERSERKREQERADRLEAQLVELHRELRTPWWARAIAAWRRSGQG